MDEAQWLASNHQALSCVVRHNTGPSMRIFVGRFLTPTKLKPCWSCAPKNRAETTPAPLQPSRSLRVLWHLGAILDPYLDKMDATHESLIVTRGKEAGLSRCFNVSVHYRLSSGAFGTVPERAHGLDYSGKCVQGVRPNRVFKVSPIPSCPL
jgi:hypothetical protein